MHFELIYRYRVKLLNDLREITDALLQHQYLVCVYDTEYWRQSMYFDRRRMDIGWLIMAKSYNQESDLGHAHALIHSRLLIWSGSELASRLEYESVGDMTKILRVQKCSR